MTNQGKKVNNLINQLGLKQRRIAEKVGVHWTTISRKAKDGTRYDMDTLEKISAELGITIDFLMDDTMEYSKGQPIPQDAILHPVKQADLPENDAIAALKEIALNKMQHRK